MIAEGTPDGGEENNRVEIEWGNKAELNFKAKDHLQLSELHNLYDFEAGAKVAGNKFYFTCHKGVKLWQSILLVTQEIIESAGFELVGVPHLVDTQIAAGTGYMPKGEEGQNYIDQEQGLTLIATSEIPLTGMHKDDVLDLKEPLLYAGISPCYRLEAGAYGKFSKGLYRTHQFEKLEMYVFCRPEDSEEYLQKILELEQKICQSFEIPHRVVRIAAGDLSNPAYKKYDVEYYSPAEKEYRELTSCSNCTDYQARNLNIKYRDKSGQLKYVHTLNGTAVVSSRMPIAILENHQQADGSIKLPKILHKHYGGKVL
jgi:seryl-tRNA synthetase